MTTSWWFLTFFSWFFYLNLMCCMWMKRGRRELKVLKLNFFFPLWRRAFFIPFNLYHYWLYKNFSINHSSSSVFVLLFFSWNLSEIAFDIFSYLRSTSFLCNGSFSVVLFKNVCMNEISYFFSFILLSKFYFFSFFFFISLISFFSIICFFSIIFLLVIKIKTHLIFFHVYLYFTLDNDCIFFFRFHHFFHLN